uniref:Uncharacterized protein n=1 Tax=Tetradesmus obliquus TaxID=3088 RepID=A0A383WIM2_TETOB|eukprot:jgi/Sobl393_1/6246/SZX76999.1
MLARTLVYVALALGVARLCGFSLLEWMLSAVAGLYLAATGVISLLWRLVHPSPEASTAALPDLHQAIFAVTRDAGRVADLLEDFFALQQREAHGDSGLKAKFMAYLAGQAHTSYSVVDNQLSWVLWLYSLIWMPLLVVLCFMRAARSAAPRGGSSSGSGKAVPAAPQQQGLLRSASAASTPRAALSAAASGGLLLPSESIGGVGWQQHELRRSSGGYSESAAGPGRGLRRYASVGTQQQQQQRSSRSGSLEAGHGLPPAASLPAHLLLATGSSSSLVGSSGGSSGKLGTYRLAVSAADGDLHADDRYAADQLRRQRGSADGAGAHMPRSSKRGVQQAAGSEQCGWQGLS